MSGETQRDGRSALRRLRETPKKIEAKNGSQISGAGASRGGTILSSFARQFMFQKLEGYLKSLAVHFG
jgi:hypothetical protein